MNQNPNDSLMTDSLCDQKGETKNPPVKCQNTIYTLYINVRGQSVVQYLIHTQLKHKIKNNSRGWTNTHNSKLMSADLTPPSSALKRMTTLSRPHNTEE